MNKVLVLLGASLTLTGMTLAQGSDDGCTPQNIASTLAPVAFDNTAATLDGAVDCEGKPARKDVWFRWQAPASGGYIVDTCSQTTLATRLVVYDDQVCPVMNPISCAAKGCSNGESKVSFPTVAGNWYIIRVGSKFAGQTGTGTFTMIFDPCWGIADDAFEDNDICDQAVPLGDGSWSNLKTAKADPDWYAIDVADGATVNYDVYFLHSMGDIDTFLFDACGGTTLVVGGSGDDNELISWTNNTGACVRTVFNVQVFPPDPSECNSYQLDITGSSPPGTCGPTNIGKNYCTPANNNSTGLPAMIEAIGSDLVADNDVTLIGTQLPVDVFGYFLASATKGDVPNPGGSEGDLCLGGQIGRYAKQIQKSGPAGDISLVVDLTSIPVDPPHSVIAGETWNFQAWFRDLDAGGTPTSNFTDGLEILFL